MLLLVIAADLRYVWMPIDHNDRCQNTIISTRNKKKTAHFSHGVFSLVGSSFFASFSIDSVSCIVFFLFSSLPSAPSAWWDATSIIFDYVYILRVTSIVHCHCMQFLRIDGTLRGCFLFPFRTNDSQFEQRKKEGENMLFVKKMHNIGHNARSHAYMSSSSSSSWSASAHILTNWVLLWFKSQLWTASDYADC